MVLLKDDCAIQAKIEDDNVQVEVNKRMMSSPNSIPGGSGVWSKVNNEKSGQKGSVKGDRKLSGS